MITLTKTSTEFGEIAIVKSRIKGSHIYWQVQRQQSEADRNGVSLATYVHAIFGLLAQTPAHDMLMIGCGGGTLGTMLARAGRYVTIVDVNAQSIALARQYFALPDEVACHVEDGASFLTRSAAAFDAIIIDAFIDERVPHSGAKSAFHIICARLNSFSWRENGSPPRVASSLMFFSSVSPGLVERNAIVMGGAVANLRVPTLHMRPEVLAEEIAGELQEMRFRGGRRSWNSPSASDRASQTP